MSAYLVFVGANLQAVFATRDGKARAKRFVIDNELLDARIEKWVPAGPVVLSGAGVQSGGGLPYLDFRGVRTSDVVTDGE